QTFNVECSFESGVWIRQPHHITDTQIGRKLLAGQKTFRALDGYRASINTKCAKALPCKEPQVCAGATSNFENRNVWPIQQLEKIPCDQTDDLLCRILAPFVFLKNIVPTGIPHSS